MTEGTLSKWYKAEGDIIKKGDVLYSLETDKLTNEIESAYEGILLKIILPSGSLAPCLSPVAVIGEANEDISFLLAQSGAPAAKEASASVAAQTAPTPATAEPGARIVASPAARKLARERRIDLSLVTGSGAGGRVELKDIESFDPSRVKISPTAAKMLSESGISPSDAGVTEGRIMKSDVEKLLAASSGRGATESKPMTRMRRVIAQRMTESWHTSPAVTLDISVDVTALAGMRASLKAEGIKASYTDFIVYIVSRTLLAHPNLNCTIEGDSIVYRNYVNMGVAVALPDGLLVPVIRDAHAKGISELTSDLASLAERARGNSLSTDDLTGGTFTISNLGMYGIESFSPIINQPEVAILGVNAIKDTVVPVNGQFVVKPLLRLSLTTDHRAVDGAVAAQFLADIRKRMENPALLLL
jgi:pyruvate dehydrogenase E2 component (dihydrolipoamide acetyltransferase)